MDAWDVLPEPKYKQPESWFVVTNIVKYGIETKRFEYAEKFLGLLFICGLKRVDFGEREFWAGRLAYSKGDMDIAKELFARSLEKSEGYESLCVQKTEFIRSLCKERGKQQNQKVNCLLTN